MTGFKLKDVEGNKSRSEREAPVKHGPAAAWSRRQVMKEGRKREG